MKTSLRCSYGACDGDTFSKTGHTLFQLVSTEKLPFLLVGTLV